MTTTETDRVKQWYIVHTYSGFEDRVRETLRQRAEALGMGEAIGEVRIPTETIVEGSFHRLERNVGKFTKTIQLPVKVDSEKVEASLADGVLRITLPKAKELLPRQIEVKVAGS